MQDAVRRTKIVATLGPASNSPAMIRQLIQAGMDVARFNFSHSSYDDHARTLACLREISRELDKPVTILQDLQGPKIRIGHPCLTSRRTVSNGAAVNRDTTSRQQLVVCPKDA